MEIQLKGHLIRPIFGFRMARWVEQLCVLALLVGVAIVMPHTAAGLGLAAGFAGMYRDAQCSLSAGQAVTITAYSTNTYDQGTASRAGGVGEPLCIAFEVTVAADTDDNDETYQFAVIQSANADLSSEDILVQTTTAFLTRAKLVAGFRFYLPIPPGMSTKRYLGAKYITAGTTPSITMDADIVPLSMVQNEQYHAVGYLIDS